MNFGQSLLVVAAAVFMGAFVVNSYPEASPAVTLTHTPRIGFGRGMPPAAAFTATLRIRNPGPTLYCPKVEWYFNGNFVSAHEADCDPWDEMTPEDQKRDYVETKRLRLGQGFWELRVVVTQGEKRHVARTELEVH